MTSKNEPFPHQKSGLRSAVLDTPRGKPFTPHRKPFTPLDKPFSLLFFTTRLGKPFSHHFANLFHHSRQTFQTTLDKPYTTHSANLSTILYYCIICTVIIPKIFISLNKNFHFYFETFL